MFTWQCIWTIRISPQTKIYNMVKRIKVWRSSQSALLSTIPHLKEETNFVFNQKAYVFIDFPKWCACGIGKHSSLANYTYFINSSSYTLYHLLAFMQACRPSGVTTYFHVWVFPAVLKCSLDDVMALHESKNRLGIKVCQSCFARPFLSAALCYWWRLMSA